MLVGPFCVGIAKKWCVVWVLAGKILPLQLKHCHEALGGGRRCGLTIKISVGCYSNVPKLAGRKNIVKK